MMFYMLLYYCTLFCIDVLLNIKELVVPDLLIVKESF